MAMAFHFSTETTILFPFWTTSTPFSFLISCGIVGLMAVGYEWLAEARRQLDRDISRVKAPGKDAKSTPATVSDDLQWKRSGYYAFSMLLSYLLSGLLVEDGPKSFESDSSPSI
jgi:hypothetical protein